MTPRSSCPGGESDSSPGRSKPPVHNKINTVTENVCGVSPSSGQIRSSSLALPSSASRQLLRRWIPAPLLRSAAPAAQPWCGLASGSIPASRRSRRLQEPFLGLQQSLPYVVAKRLSQQYIWLETETGSCHPGSNTTPLSVLSAHSHLRGLHCGCDSRAPDPSLVSSLHFRIRHDSLIHSHASFLESRPGPVLASAEDEDPARSASTGKLYSSFSPFFRLFPLPRSPAVMDEEVFHEARRALQK